MKYMIIIGASALVMHMSHVSAIAQEAIAPSEIFENTVQSTVDAAATQVQSADPVPTTTSAKPKIITTTLPAGSMVKFRMDKALATDKRGKVDGKKLPKGQRRITNEGDIFTMSVLNDVMHDGVTVIPAGSTAHGEVTAIKGRGGFGKSGKIEITMKYVEVDGQQYAIEGTHFQKGKGRGGAAIAGTVIAGVVAGAFIKGDEADIPLATEFEFITGENITVTGPVEQSVAAEAVEADSISDVMAEDIDTDPSADDMDDNIGDNDDASDGEDLALGIIN